MKIKKKKLYTWQIIWKTKQNKTTRQIPTQAQSFSLLFFPWQSKSGLLWGEATWEGHIWTSLAEERTNEQVQSSIFFLIQPRHKEVSGKQALLPVKGSPKCLLGLHVSWYTLYNCNKPEILSTSTFCGFQQYSASSTFYLPSTCPSGTYVAFNRKIGKVLKNTFLDSYVQISFLSLV